VVAGDVRKLTERAVNVQCPYGTGLHTIITWEPALTEIETCSPKDRCFSRKVEERRPNMSKNLGAKLAGAQTIGITKYCEAVIVSFFQCYFSVIIESF
jgi:hypothetical protein